jgi:hypothetical protein
MDSAKGLSFQTQFLLLACVKTVILVSDVTEDDAGWTSYA